MTQVIYFASDHAGVELKQALCAIAPQQAITAIDLGPDSDESVDYPDYAQKLAGALANDPEGSGVLICGSGIGMTIAANRHHHIRAALCHSPESARLSRGHNDANVLVLGARFLDQQQAIDIFKAFCKGSFEGGRHQRRIDKLAAPL